MYCPNCGSESDEGARFCKNCGKAMSDAGRFEPETGGRPGYTAQLPRPAKSKVAAGVFALVLGGLGIHKFYLGYTGPGVILLLGSIISVVLWILLIGFIGTIAIGTIVLIEGILYLTKTDEEFHNTYVVNKKDWF